MPYSIRRLIGRIARSAVFYRLVPHGPARVFSGLRYHYARKSWSDVTQIAKADSRHTTERLSSGMLAARAAFYAAEDDVAEAITERLLDRFPAEPAIFEFRANIRRFQSRYDEALADAEWARLLVPSSRKAVAEVICYSYLVNPPDVADRISLEEVRRYPRSEELYWAAASGCRDAEQFERIIEIWREFNEPESITSLVRPLATAADHAGEIQAACDLYRDAIQMAAEMGVPEADDLRSNFVATPKLATDVHDVMKDAGVPYFFARGTALALARQGQQVGRDGKVDVGVFSTEWNRSLLENAFSTDPRFALKEQHPKEPSVGLVHRSNVEVNILRFYLEDGRIWHDSIFSRAWNTPFKIKMCEFGEKALAFPSDLATHVHETYGDSRLPSTISPVDAPNLEVTWPEYARLVRLRRAFEQVCAGDPAAAAKELVAAEEGELASVIEVGRG